MSQLIEIFKAGTRRDANGQLLTITESDLSAIADGYNVEFHEAPVVVGHPKDNAPAYGWVDSLVAKGKTLYAKFKQVDADFSELVNTGRFKKISASFYLPNSSSNPKQGAYYLRHVGFLGAMPPAVKGLKNPSFADGDSGFVLFSEKLETETPVQDTLPPAEPHGYPDITEEDLIHHHNNDNTEGKTMSEKDKEVDKNADLQSENERLKAENAQLKAEKIAERKSKAEADNAAFAEQLVSEGKLLPKHKDEAIKLLNADIAGIDYSAADFSEDSCKTDLKTFLSQLPQVADFSETASKDKAAEPADESVEYAEGTDPQRIALDQKARAYMAKHNCDYATAINAVV
ncbi:MAG: peptidase [Gammaproteobacteria bacterium]|nr:peptidase [Gammaproteobacteria bacterium]